MKATPEREIRSPQEALDLSGLLGSRIAAGTKGLPPDLAGVEVRTIGQRGLNLLAGQIPLPACVLLDDAVAHNRATMREFTERMGVRLAPHGKTSMAPQLFAEQLQDGAWGLTAATPAQLFAYRSVNVRRILYANQLVDTSAIEFVARELQAAADFEFLCLVDSRASVAILREVLQRMRPARPIDVLVEVGISGHRAGARTVADALAVAREVLAAAPFLRLRGVEAFEGVVPDSPDTVTIVESLLEKVSAVLSTLDASRAFADLTPVVSVGGSAYFGLVAQRLRALPVAAQIVLRSGCYLVNDHGLYARLQQSQMALGHLALSAPLRPALEVWGHVHSRPEAGLAILGIGKRDISHDIELPVAIKWAKRGSLAAVGLPPTLKVVGLNDQHAMLRVPAAHPLEPGDRVALGCSHPCTTLDKWRALLKVDRDYNVIDAIVTLF